jgi:hypothetical protein
MATVTYHGTSVCAVARIVSRNTDLARRVWQRSLPSGPVYCVHRGRSAPLVVGGYGGDRRPQRVQAWDGYWGRVACDAQYGLPRTPFGRRSNQGYAFVSSKWPAPSSFSRTLNAKPSTTVLRFCIAVSASVPFCKRGLRGLYALANSSRSVLPSVSRTRNLSSGIL